MVATVQLIFKAHAADSVAALSVFMT